MIIKATETRKCTNEPSEIIDNDTDDEDVMILLAYLKFESGPMIFASCGADQWGHV